MSETRRQLFKTSIMSALGIAATAGVAGCTTTTSLGLNPLQPGAHGNDTIVGVDANNTWYLFIYDGPGPAGDPLYKVLSSTTPYASLYPGQFPFDTSLFTNPLPTAGPGFQRIQNGSFVVYGIPYSVENGYLKEVQQLLNNTNNRVLSQSYWNEVGKQ